MSIQDLATDGDVSTFFRGLKVSVIGAARSGISAAAVLQILGADVLLSDQKPPDQLDVATLGHIESLGLNFVPAAAPATAVPVGTDLVVTSPGVPADSPVLVHAREAGVEIWSEIELAYRLSPCAIIAITGTNGKTTTTVLTAEILKAAGRDAVIAGNVSADEIKRTLVDAAFAARQERASHRVLVAEVSSFQLEWVKEFSPWIGILTNITPDHLNRHKSFEEYADAKANLFTAQAPDNWSLFNMDDSMSRSVALRNTGGKRLWVSNKELNIAAPSAYVADGKLVVELTEGERTEILPVSEMPPSLPGAHSIQNALMAAAAAMIAGVPAPTIARAIVEFKGVAHRMEIVDTIGEVRYINNSMCTNVAASVASLTAVGENAVLIAGGADKGLDFRPMVEPLIRFARKTFLIGAAADKMESAFRQGGYNEIQRCSTLDEAVQCASVIAKPGDTVILSPGCASFDMFRDFEDRGAAFRSSVNALKQRGTT